MTSNILTTDEMVKVIDLGYAIRECLRCNTNGYNIPCQACRLATVQHMKRYLEIHGYTVTEPESRYLDDA